MDKVTFIIPAFNVEQYIEDTLDSVLSQTETRWEAIIIDDCSTDHTLQIAERYAKNDSRIKVIRMDVQSGGAYLPRKIGILEASTDFIAPLDADDKIDPDYLKNLLDLQHSTNADIIYPVMYKFEDGKISSFSTFDSSLIGKNIIGKEAVQYTLDGWRIHCNGGLLRRTLYLKGFDQIDDKNEYFKIYIDEYLTRILLYESKVVCVCAERYLYRVNPTSVTHIKNFKSFGLLSNDLKLLKFVAERYSVKSETFLLMQRQNFHVFFDGLRLLRNTVLDEKEEREAENLLRECKRQIKYKFLKSVGWKYLVLSKLPYSLCKGILKIIDWCYHLNGR